MPANNIHPKTSAAALGGALGLVIVTVLDSLHGINLSGAASAAIPTFLSTLGAYVAPSSQTDTQPAVDPVPVAVADDMGGLEPQPDPAVLAPELPPIPAAPGSPGGPTANPHPPGV